MHFKKAFSILSILLCFSSSLWAQQSSKPNIIFILTDDLGYGDVGVFFQNQRRLANDRSTPWTLTPHLDQMAARGAVLEQYSAAPVCAPSRGSILSGRSQGHANVRDNQFDKALEDNYTLGNVMQMAGYETAAIGKWGLQGSKKFDKNGADWPAVPTNRGFDSYYGYMRHVDGHEHYPKEGLYRGKKEVYENDKDVSEDLDKCYTGDLFTARAKKFIVEHTKGKGKSEPFMMYLAYDTPHAVIELPTSAYPEGFGLDGGLQWLGKAHHMINSAKGTPDSYYHPDYANATYDDDGLPSTPEVAWPDVYKRYATVTRRIDNQVHDIISLLKDLGIDDNTLVVFTSDNGPSKESYLKGEPYHPTFFGGSGPFDGIKRDVWEGGVREPTIALWPGHIQAGTVISQPSISYDWMATFTEMAGLPKPVVSDGTSLLPLLIGEGDYQSHPIYVEYFQNGRTPDYDTFMPSHRGRTRNQMQMIRLGDTVAVRYDIQSADDDFEIYDIRKDSHQNENLAQTKDMQAFQKILKAKALQMRKADTSAVRPYDEALIPGVIAGKLKKGWLRSEYANASPWLGMPNGKAKQTKTSIDVSVEDGTNMHVFEGLLEVPESGEYTFGLAVKGKAFLRLHEIALIDEDYNYASGTKKEGTLHLSKGLHPIRLYYLAEKGQKAEIEWSCLGQNGQDISKAIYHEKL
ncbi:sulfatase-like hydrolase/transferase [Marinilongibacter aquaticus]|uniref:sulfatase-like hydrolase/transferase n=1 Tax=Marinilongibacter aquaticus TaxID=2975157 RepID=UPI0021BDA3A3|nr:sulfatase-like hydrolase/transferase [Marinilongibacter aquaticus]UBM59145.1 sulfatase-like hydrolase/transferase [Marinilongibacter aquaticus]